MKLSLATLVIAAASAAVSPSASAVVLTFDDIGADTAVPATYGGLDWSGSDWFVYGQVQEPFTAHSGSFRAVSGFGDADAATAFRSTTPFTFQGAWFAGLQGATVTFGLYLQGTLVATSATLDPSATPTFLASGFADQVDRVVVSSPGQGSYAMDDVTFNATAPVPEPESYALLMAGLGVMGWVARRRMNSSSR